MTKLAIKVLSSLQKNGIRIPSYRAQTTQPEIGIVHLGPGAFFRGHQAWYTHRAIELAGGDWGICCVSMRSGGVAEALNPQEGLYTLAVLDSVTSYEVVGSVTEVLVAQQDYQKVMSRLTAASTKFVTMTITEKGYCLDSKGELDLNHPDIKQDLSGGAEKMSAIGLLVDSLAIRHKQGLPPFVVMSCDNLTDNGKKLQKALVTYAQQFEQKLADWLTETLISPCSMVDSITPATNEELKQQVKTELGIEDNWPIKREAFLQWVIEDILPVDAPAWAKAGATLTGDVRGFENAKLRMLNCPHSTMAYLGVLLGIETVYDAMQNHELVEFIHSMIKNEVIPSFSAPVELDVVKYQNDILNRFRNPAIRHLLAQIAWDGSQKLPMRILPIIEDNLAKGLAIEKLTTAIAAWMLFVRKRQITAETLVDPLAQQLGNIATQCTGLAQNDVALFLHNSGVFTARLIQNTLFVEHLSNAYDKLVGVLTEGKINWAALDSKT